MLDRLLPRLPRETNPNLIVGPSTLDDAGVFLLNDSLALVQTVDFFTPIVDDPFDYGRVAAANSISDVYAMGGKPLTALNIVAFPDGTMDEDALAEILLGAAEVCHEAGVAIAGGHSVSDQELKFGLAVTGTVDPKKMLTNGGARPGDALVLTKPLGTGLIANAMMNDAAPDEDVQRIVEVMVRLNRTASEIALELGAHGATDVTGFGLLGHAREMAMASGMAATIYANRLPVIPGAERVAASGSFYSGGERRNLAFAERNLAIDDTVPDPIRRIAADPQTSGGLLISLAPEQVNAFLSKMKEAGEEAWHIGTVDQGEPGHLHLATGE